MMNKVHDGATYVLSSTSILMGAADITEVLNIILVILGIVNILLIIGFKIYSIITNKNTDDKQKKTTEVLQNGINEINKLKDVIKDEAAKKETERNDS